MCICEPIHEIARERDRIWRIKTMPLEERIKACLELYERELRKDAQIFEEVRQ